MTRKRRTARERVLARYPDAHYSNNPMTGQHVIFADFKVKGLSWENEDEAWADAARNLRRKP